MNLTTTALATVTSLSADAEDRDLAARLARGEPDAFDQLVEQYGRRVIGLAARLLNWSDGAEDVAQDVFLAVLRKGTTFRGEARLWTFLAAITVNRCRSVRRRRWLHEHVLRRIVPPRSEQLAADQPGQLDETVHAIRAAVARLPTTYREVIVLKYLEELSVGEVADVLGLRRNTVEVRLSRARRLLEELLTDLTGNS